MKDSTNTSNDNNVGYVSTDFTVEFYSLVIFLRVQAHKVPNAWQ